MLSLSLLVACGPAAVPVSPDAGSEVSPDAAIPEGPPSCELVQAPLAQPADARSVLVTPSSFFIGDARGLWRSHAIDERFERVTSLEAAPVLMLARTDDGTIFVVLGEGRVRTSSDDGEHWLAFGDLPSLAVSSADRLYTDGERVVAHATLGESIAHLYDLDRTTGLWTEIVAEAPVEGWGHSGFVLVGVDRGALLATPSGYRSGGLFRLEPGAPRWERIEDLGDANGFTSFARRGEVAVVASPAGIWAEIEGAYRRVLTEELLNPLIVATNEGFVGVDARRVLRSNDGLEWVTEPLEAGSPAVVSENAGRLAILRRELGYPSTPSLSADLGASWREPMIVSQTFERVSIHGDGRITYASPLAWWRYDGVSTWRHGAWTTVTWPLDFGASAVAMTDAGAWICSFEECVHRTDDGEVGSAIALPDGPYAHEPAAAFATSHGLFVSPRGYGTPCGVVQPGLVVLRDEATWEDASAGLRSSSPECAGTPSFVMVRAMFERDGVLFATQAQGHLEPAFEPVVLRSDDSGRSWTTVRENAELVALVQTEAGAFALFEPGTIEAFDGETFAPVAQPGERVTDIVALDGRLVAATSDANGSSLWMSADGAQSWQPLLVEARIGPITDLDASGAVLAIASSTSGLWEATGCFAE